MMAGEALLTLRLCIAISLFPPKNWCSHSAGFKKMT
uniref:Uncharacterized protein n=1 Tax=Anguilla anguilla TaxID=7936 RepID=A0A0E9PNZ6_ANGAN